MKTMIAAKPLMIIAAAALLAGVGCASSGAEKDVSSLKTKASRNSVLHIGRQGNNGQVSLLARAFLPSSAKAHSGFAYYGYLVFTDSTPASAFARRTASKFYLGMLAQGNAAKERAGTPRENMAVLYLPLSDSAAADVLIKEQDAQAVVAAYDYTRARGLSTQLKRAGKTVPGVAIIGSTRPLAAGEAPGSVDVLDLTDPGTVAERMERFRDALETGERQMGEDGQALVLKRLRAYFASAAAPGRDGPTQLTF